MTRWTSVAGLLLVGGCTFGVDGDFADTELGLVSAESLRIEDATTRGYAEAVRVRPDGSELVIDFERGETTGELRFSDLSAVIARGGEGVLRLRDGTGRPLVRSVWLSSRERSFADPEIALEFETLGDEAEPNVQAAQVVDEGEPSTVEAPPEDALDPTITGTVLLLVEPRGYDC